MVVIFLLEDFSLLLVKINHLLLTSDPETNANELWITSALSCSPSKATAAPIIRSCKKTYLNLSMASTAPCLCSSSFGGGGSLPSPPSLLPFSLPPFFFFPGIALARCLTVAQLLSFTTPRTVGGGAYHDQSWENPPFCACAVH